MSNTIGERIAALRKEKGITQEQLGVAVGISGQAVSKWENGGMPDSELLPVIADILDVSIDRLFGREKFTSDLDKNTDSPEQTVTKFCEYAIKNGRAKTIREAISRLMNKRIVAPPSQHTCVVLENGENVLVSDPCGMGFVMNGTEFSNYCLNMEQKRINNLLKLITDEKAFSIIKLVAQKTSTLKEICKATGFDELSAKGILLELCNSAIVAHGVDRSGKQGYCPASGMVAVWLVLSGCSLISLDGIRGCTWLSV